MIIKNKLNNIMIININRFNIMMLVMLNLIIKVIILMVILNNLQKIYNYMFKKNK